MFNRYRFIQHALGVRLNKAHLTIKSEFDAESIIGQLNKDLVTITTQLLGLLQHIPRAILKHHATCIWITSPKMVKLTHYNQEQAPVLFNIKQRQGQVNSGTVGFMVFMRRITQTYQYDFCKINACIH